MKTPTEIKQKIRNIEYEYLKRVYQARLSKEPQNCLYNKRVVLPGSEKAITRVCAYFTDADTIQACNTSECSRNCNAFVCRHDKKTLRDLLQEDVRSNPTKYPELMVLGWTLDGEIEQDDSTEATEQATITKNVTAISRWQKTKTWCSDLFWSTYLKYLNLIERLKP